MTTAVKVRPTKFARLQCGRGTGDPTTSTLGDVQLYQAMGTISSTDTVATACAVVPNGATLCQFDVDVTTAFEASAACNIEFSLVGQTNFFGTFGVSAVGRYTITPKSGAQATAWQAVSAPGGNASNTARITCKVTSATTPSGGAALVALRYVVNNGPG